MHGPAWVCTRWSPSAKRKSGHKTTSVMQKISSIDNHSKIKNYFSLMESHRACKLLLRAEPMTNTRWLTQNELIGIFGGSLSHNVL